MITKEKKINYKIIIFLIIIIWLVALSTGILIKNKTVTYAATDMPNIKISNAEKIKLEQILKSKSEKEYREEIVTQNEELEYITQYKNNDMLSKGKIQVLQEGRTGLQTVTIKKKYFGEDLISEEQINSIITKSAINKIVEIGTNSRKSTYKVAKGEKVFVISDRAFVMLDKDVQSEKITTVVKNTELTVLQVENDWYKIAINGTFGWIKIENTTYIDPNPIEDNSMGESTYNGKYSFNMALNKPSGLSLEQFKKILKDSKDVNNIFSSNAEYFYYIEKQYNINGIFVAAIGIHESAWGTSKIALNKNNLFGYGAYDSSPSYSAYSFTTYAEGIDLIARVLVKNYLNPSGTKIYDGEIATGKYYNGNTLIAVNQKYATDKNWANGVYKHMEYLYKKI